MTVITRYSTAAADTRAGGDMPLYFELTTDPNPVRVSPSAGDPQRADLVLVGSRRSMLAIECRKITVTVPTGDGSADLTPDITSIAALISLKDWTPRTDPATKTITFTPSSGYTVIGRDEGVTVQLMGARISTLIGSAPLPLAVEWREADSDDPWATGNVTFDIGKFPAAFHLDNFMAERLIIDNGDPVKLNWEATGASSVKLLYGSAEIDVTNKSTWTVDNVGQTTVFYLRGTVQDGNNTAERTLSTTVTVRVPDLEVNHLTVVGNLTVGKSTDTVIERMSSFGDVDPDHPLENILDRSPGSYCLMARAQSPSHTFITLDRGEDPEPLTSIEFITGDGSGNLGATALILLVSETGTRFERLLSERVSEFRFTAPEGLKVRYVRAAVDESPRSFAVRAFWVNPSIRLHITDTSADFAVPIEAKGGIDS
ncbi:hypothetical protein [Nocardia sp. BMG111209]|uniref:hypothetical protein n=1 Tax=Nocardia sp. BMG111209 TaxID=1160137 RepID=UPI0003649ABE|nr:hypothetical protein [Nocardia sp. BMG111209]